MKLHLDATRQAANNLPSKPFERFNKNFLNSTLFFNEYYSLSFIIDGLTIDFNNYHFVPEPKQPIGIVNENVMKVYNHFMEYYNCSLHKQLNNLTQMTDDIQYDEPRQKVIDGLKQVKEQMDQANYDQDKDELIENAKDISAKLKNMQNIVGPTTQFGQAIYYFKANLRGFFYDIYGHNVVAKGQEMDNKVQDQMQKDKN